MNTNLPAKRPIPVVPNLSYTWMISGVLYHGGADKLFAALHEKGLNECHFYNVNGSPIGQRVIAGGLASSFDVEEFHVIVSADQADTIFEFIYEFTEMAKPNVGIMHMSRLLRSTPNTLPDGLSDESEKAAS